MGNDNYQFQLSFFKESKWLPHGHIKPIRFWEKKEIHSVNEVGIKEKATIKVSSYQ